MTRTTTPYTPTQEDISYFNQLYQFLTGELGEGEAPSVQGLRIKSIPENEESPSSPDSFVLDQATYAPFLALQEHSLETAFPSSRFWYSVHDDNTGRLAAGVLRVGARLYILELEFPFIFSSEDSAIAVHADPNSREQAPLLSAVSEMKMASPPDGIDSPQADLPRILSKKLEELVDWFSTPKAQVALRSWKLYYSYLGESSLSPISELDYFVALLGKSPYTFRNLAAELAKSVHAPSKAHFMDALSRREPVLARLYAHWERGDSARLDPHREVLAKAIKAVSTQERENRQDRSLSPELSRHFWMAESAYYLESQSEILEAHLAIGFRLFADTDYFSHLAEVLNDLEPQSLSASLFVHPLLQFRSARYKDGENRSIPPSVLADWLFEAYRAQNTDVREETAEAWQNILDSAQGENSRSRILGGNAEFSLQPYLQDEIRRRVEALEGEGQIKQPLPVSPLKGVAVPCSIPIFLTTTNSFRDGRESLRFSAASAAGYDFREEEDMTRWLEEQEEQAEHASMHASILDRIVHIPREAESDSEAHRALVAQFGALLSLGQGPLRIVSRNANPKPSAQSGALSISRTPSTNAASSMRVLPPGR